MNAKKLGEPFPAGCCGPPGSYSAISWATCYASGVDRSTCAPAGHRVTDYRAKGWNWYTTYLEMVEKLRNAVDADIVVFWRMHSHSGQASGAGCVGCGLASRAYVQLVCPAPARPRRRLHNPTSS